MKPGPSEFKPPIPGRESSSRPEPPPPVRPEPEEPAPPPPEPALKPESLPPVKPESAVAVEKTSPETAASPTPAPGTAKPAEPPTVPESLAGPIHFDFDRATIKARDTAVLRAVADRLRQTPDALVLVSGYCDPRGDAEYNAELGLRRAEAVRDWLVQQGIDTHRIDIESWGASAVETAEPARYWAERRCEIHIPGQGK
jgi:outer membrane protein OmpA-like peptidoglycan-associated protein